jgi:uncharacterized protein
MRGRTGRAVLVGGVVVALAVGGVGLGLAASQSPGAPLAQASPSALCASSAPKLTVAGSGLASATPNLLTVAIDINVTGSGAQVSLTDDSSRAGAVTAVLEPGGVAAQDIQTSDVSLQPQYSLTGAVTGYQMSNTITAKLRDFTTAGSILDQLASAGGNATRIDSLTFSIADPRSIEDQARTDAVHQAVSHAQSMARAAGERLGPVCSMSDQSSATFPQYNTFDEAAPGMTASGATVPLEAGTQQESAQVTLVYGLEQLGPRR